jgi:hypothetical protein
MARRPESDGCVTITKTSLDKKPPRHWRCALAAWSVRSFVLLGLLRPFAAHATFIDCRAAAQVAEQEVGLPAGLLFAIGEVETGRQNVSTGQIEPWSWSTNMAGVSHYFGSETEAIDWTAMQLALGQRSIDVGCFQINLMHHPEAFITLEEAFDPLANARYAARFLLSLYRRSANWQVATAQYHSADPSRGGPYGARVFALLAGAMLPVASLTEVGYAARFERVMMPAGPAVYGIQVLVPGWRRASAPGVQPIMQRMGTPTRTARGLPRVFTPGMAN